MNIYQTWQNFFKKKKIIIIELGIFQESYYMLQIDDKSETPSRSKAIH